MCVLGDRESFKGREANGKALTDDLNHSKFATEKGRNQHSLVVCDEESIKVAELTLPIPANNGRIKTT